MLSWPNLWATLRLPTRVGLAAGSILVASAIGLQFLLVREDASRQRRALAEELRIEVATLAAALTEPVLVGDFALIGDLIDARVRHEDVVHAGWIDAAGRVVEKRTPAVNRTAPDWFVRNIGVADVRAESALQTGGESYGTVFVALSAAHAANKMWAAAVDRALLSLASASACLALTLWVLTSGLRPFAHLTVAARRFGKGDYALRLPPHGPPEARECIDAFNRMGDDVSHLVKSLRGAETKLQQANSELESRVDARTRELHDANAELKAEIAERKTAQDEAARARQSAEAASHAKSQFLANMSHEIRTPMNGVLGMAELLLDTPLSPAQEELALGLQRSGATLLSLINDILDLSKIEAGRLELERLPLDLHDLVGDVIDLLRVSAREKGVELQSRIAPDVPRHLIGDPLRLRQILTNLAGNALKFTARGSVTIAVTVDQAPACLMFRVEDTGVGIAADALKRLFTPFTQADQSTTRRYGGTGLGLAISKQLAEAMGGTIGAESVAGAGSTFWFTAALTLGAAPAPIGDSGGVGPRELGAIDQLHILLVEDNAMNRQIAVAMLKSFGCRVDCAETGREALERVGTRAYDLILMDCQMPEMDGFDATRAIRAYEAEATAAHAKAPAFRTPVIALTANALAGDRERCIAAGMDDYLSKPFNKRDLRAMIERWVRSAARNKSRATAV